MHVKQLHSDFLDWCIITACHACWVKPQVSLLFFWSPPWFPQVPANLSHAHQLSTPPHRHTSSSCMGPKEIIHGPINYKFNLTNHGSGQINIQEAYLMWVCGIFSQTFLAPAIRFLSVARDIAAWQGQCKFAHPFDSNWNHCHFIPSLHAQVFKTRHALHPNSSRISVSESHWVSTVILLVAFF